ncbi:ornithine carbamoyltransferase [Candidatus Nanopelagicus hibericus]|uniref:Ornithine carbamoyltransferase n=1 Tax=Candidatus Nanopelagicus hibericus TaxID=1884915 RepID=A0A249KA54_9ACTN|nr:ornithine carbamoyltransferase [Candidatus Nanopelagicus hibericus]ASY13667.1 ornithine carbamoyltransferase [Candidatus Nanopelagicus hibericus]
MSTPLKDLLRTSDLSKSDIQMLLETAGKFAKKPLQAKKTLAKRTVAIYMTKSSTRTRLASESAVAHLGGTPIFMRADDLQIGRGESIADTAKVISGFCSALIVRTFAQSDVDELGKYASIPVINALTDDDHPTQLLADWLTITERFGKSFKNRKFVYVGDGNNVANAWLIMGATMGAHVVVATPQGKWAPKAAVVNQANEIAKKSGGKIEILTDPKSAAKGASAIYTDVWMSMGDSEADRNEKISALTPFSVTRELMNLTAKDSIFMHCLPAHRGEEVAADVIDGEQSVVWRQAFHRRTTIQSLLYHLTRGELKGNK